MHEKVNTYLSGLLQKYTFPVDSTQIRCCFSVIFTPCESFIHAQSHCETITFVNDVIKIGHVDDAWLVSVSEETEWRDTNCDTMSSCKKIAITAVSKCSCKFMNLTEQKITQAIFYHKVSAPISTGSLCFSMTSPPLHCSGITKAELSADSDDSAEITAVQRLILHAKKAKLLALLFCRSSQ